MSDASAKTKATQREYPPYSGPEPYCPKCFHEGASTLYMQVGECIHGSTNCWRGDQANERLHRECENCGYSWDEAIR